MTSCEFCGGRNGLHHPVACVEGRERARARRRRRSRSNLETIAQLYGFVRVHDPNVSKAEAMRRAVRAFERGRR